MHFNDFVLNYQYPFPFQVHCIGIRLRIRIRIRIRRRIRIRICHLQNWTQPHLLSHPCATLPQQQQQQQQMLSTAIICAAPRHAPTGCPTGYGRERGRGYRAQIAFEVESQHLGDSEWRLRVQRGRQTVSPTGYCPACPRQSVSVLSLCLSLSYSYGRFRLGV